MKALFERLNRSRQPRAPPPISESQWLSNFPSQRGHVFDLLPAIRGGQLRPPSRFHSQIESALQDYERETGFNLVNHPVAKRLQGCQRIFDAVDILREQAQGIRDHYHGRLMKSLNYAVCVLHKLSISTVLREVAGLVRQRMQMGISCL